MAVLESHDVTRNFREGREVIAVLKGVSIAVERGEVVGLEGPSGSGKTTLLFILGGLLTPSSGRVIIDGEEVDASLTGQLPDLRKRSIGFVFQHFNLFPALTALENVEYALNIKGVRGPAARREADRLLEVVDLADRRRLRSRHLSGGQKQRVAIARALAGQAPIILADEPTASVDSQMGSQILELFVRLARVENRAILIVSHDTRVRDIADRNIQIRDGCLLS